MGSTAWPPACCIRRPSSVSTWTDCRQASAQLPLPRDVVEPDDSWPYTVMVFPAISESWLSPRCCIRGTPRLPAGIFGKINTACQIAAVFFALLSKVYLNEWVWMTKQVLLYGVFAFTMASAIHYVFLTGQRLKHCRRQGKETSKITAALFVAACVAHATSQDVPRVGRHSFAQQRRLVATKVIPPNPPTGIPSVTSSDTPYITKRYGLNYCHTQYIITL